MTPKLGSALGILITALGLLLLLYFTNPTTEDHRRAVKNQIEITMPENSDAESNWEQVRQSVGMAIGGDLIDKCVSRKNFFLFSLTHVSLNESTEYVGLGIIDNVFIFPNTGSMDSINSYIEEKMEERSKNVPDSIPAP